MALRAWAIVLAILVIVPAAGALVAPKVPPRLPDDLGDGDLLLLLSAYKGWDVTRPAPVVVPPGMTLGSAVAMLHARTGGTLPESDIAAFDQLDPRVQLSVLPLLVAIDEAWTLRDQAFTTTNGGAPDLPTLIRAAILLLDTAEGIVMPQVDALADAGIWPTTPVADSVGILRLGGTGNDVENADRLLQIDPRGDDTYTNNAGGNTILSGEVLTPKPRDFFPIAISIDLSGNDIYRQTSPTRGTGIQGSGWSGIGILLDTRGNDHYECYERCQGHGVDGVGLLRDYAGTDQYVCRSSCLATASEGLAIVREDHGDDRFNPYSFALAAGERGPGVALFWERQGTDNYLPSGQGSLFYGGSFVTNAADSLFVDEGTSLDMYSASVPHAKNGERWWRGTPQDWGNPNGQGNDNAGGLALVLSTHWP